MAELSLLTRKKLHCEKNGPEFSNKTSVAASQMGKATNTEVLWSKYRKSFCDKTLDLGYGTDRNLDLDSTQIFEVTVQFHVH